MIEYKNTEDGVNSVKDIDDKSRRVVTVLNKTNYKDSDNDIIEATAFNRTIKNNGPKGKNLIYHLTDHIAGLRTTVGKFSELYMDGDNLVGVTLIPKTTWGNDVLEFYKSGTISQHSIGFNTVQKEVMNENDSAKRYTIIKEIKLYEGSAVLWAANDQTPMLSVGKSLLTEDQKVTLFKSLLEEGDNFSKVLKTGKISDETGELLTLYVKQIQDAITNLLSPTQPASTEALDSIKEEQERHEASVYEKLLLINLKLKSH